MKRLLLMSGLLLILLAFGLLGEEQVPRSAPPLQQPPWPLKEMHTVVAEARLTGSGPYHEVGRIKGVPPAKFPGPGIWQVDVYCNVKWVVVVKVNKPKEESVAWGHVEAQVKFYDKVIKFMPEIPSIERNYLRMEGQSLHFTRVVDTDLGGGPDLSFYVNAGGGGFNGGSFSSHASIVAQVAYEFTLIKPKGQPEVPKAKEVKEETKEWLKDHKEELEKRLGVQISGDHKCVIGKIVWYPERPCAGEPIYFAVQRGEKPVSVYWSFGDGTISNQELTVHVYGDPGDYELQAVIRCEDGTEHTRTVDLHITPCKKPRPDPEKLKAYAKALAFHAKNLSYQQYLILKKRYYKIHWATETAKAVADAVLAVMGRLPKPETISKAMWLGATYTIPSAATITLAATHRPAPGWLQRLWEQALNLSRRVAFKVAVKNAELMTNLLEGFVYSISDHYDKQALDAINALADQANDPPAVNYMESGSLQTPSLLILGDETKFSAIEQAAVTIANCQSWQNAIDEAFVRSFEQYQGALMSGDTSGIELQAMCLKKYALRALENLSTLLQAVDVSIGGITEHKDTIGENLREAREQISSQTTEREGILSKLSMDEITILITWTYAITPENLMEGLNVLRRLSREKMEMYTNILRYISWIYPDPTLSVLKLR